LPGPVVAHGRAGVGLAGGFLDVPQGHAGVDGRDKGVADVWDPTRSVMPVLRARLRMLLAAAWRSRREPSRATKTGPAFADRGGTHP
jgi:hypothetical protein